MTTTNSSPVILCQDCQDFRKFDGCGTIVSHGMTSDRVCGDVDTDKLGQDTNGAPDPVDATDLARMADTYQRADQWRHNAMTDLQIAIRRAAQTMSEAEMVRGTGLTRTTVRRALGK